jgi:uncharacterized DUF497 family protein
MTYAFRWNDWNLGHTAKHGVTAAEIERVINRARPPFPQEYGEGKYLVIGRGAGGRWLQAIYVIDEDGTIYPIHARPLSEAEKRRVRRRLR